MEIFQLELHLKIWQYFSIQGLKYYFIYIQYTEAIFKIIWFPIPETDGSYTPTNKFEPQNSETFFKTNFSRHITYGIGQVNGDISYDILDFSSEFKVNISFLVLKSSKGLEVIKFSL